MAMVLYTPPWGGTDIVYTISDAALAYESTGFLDMFPPKTGKDEWGIETLDRQCKGPACNFDKFYDALAQGQQYIANGKTFYLQTFKPIEDKVCPGVSMVYKGLPFGNPKTLITGGQVELSGTLTCSTPQKASRTIRYDSWKSTFRYITNTKPTGPANIKLDVDVTPQITFSEITDASGNPIFDNTSPQLVTALTPAGFYDLATLDSSVPILGTPYYECADTVTRLLPVS